MSLNFQGSTIAGRMRSPLGLIHLSENVLLNEGATLYSWRMQGVGLHHVKQIPLGPDCCWLQLDINRSGSRSLSIGTWTESYPVSRRFAEPQERDLPAFCCAQNASNLPIFQRDYSPVVSIAGGSLAVGIERSDRVIEPIAITA
ncbi:hypothetical protein CFAM422_006222 [Trichoderma lentiforme]|uniref:Uncharacterized protein n=1 Tax=Trichoderma lentiforme TaxID=1567552 RepID=A0A9P4XGM8_9HYPO|nr:hypothetical protein CFAM422_006222 [Trichoderma lentiforme]